jgi:hypothetical protein
VRRDVEAGRPNACTACHADKTALWAADRMREFWGPHYERPRSRPDRAPLEVPEALASLHAGDPVLRAVMVDALAHAGSAVPPRERGFLLANALVALGDAYGAIRHLARLSALDLDRTTGARLAFELRGFDPQAPREQRDQALKELLSALSARATGKLAPPPAGTFVANDYELDVQGVRALLGLQATQVISVGE